MDQLIDSFPQQIKDALEISRTLDLSPGKEEIHEVVIAGMGGSGIGGDFVQQIVSDECLVPVFVIKGYDLPVFADKNLPIQERQKRAFRFYKKHLLHPVR